ncbi:FadR/GntR family transcriptional regulator [Nocardia spumae]|uniref:FadR/GntR family transcriptional regulator n=1 Tax=Nocardia spumae TaxID=2887190 RepID=UPI001D133AF6|nr:GntR family transcriptional regulator [Nocardia spumae]
MEFTAVSRTAVSDTVFGQLVDAILSGRIAPGDALPSERELAETFQVNRHAVREALRRVQQGGLVRIAQGGKTRVQDWRAHSGLDVLSALAAAGALPPQRLLRDIAVMRRSVAADAARLCALTADADQIAAIEQAARNYPDATADLSELTTADLEFWTAVIDGSGNVAYRLAMNTLVNGYFDIGMPVIAELGLNKEYIDAEIHRELARRIAARDADGAYTLAREFLGRFAAALGAKD